MTSKHWTNYKIAFTEDGMVHLRLRNPGGISNFLATFTLAEWSQMARTQSPPKPSRSTMSGDLANTRYPQ